MRRGAYYLLLSKFLEGTLNGLYTAFGKRLDVAGLFEKSRKAAWEEYSLAVMEQRLQKLQRK